MDREEVATMLAKHLEMAGLESHWSYPWLTVSGCHFDIEAKGRGTSNPTIEVEGKRFYQNKDRRYNLGAMVAHIIASLPPKLRVKKEQEDRRTWACTLVDLAGKCEWERNPSGLFQPLPNVAVSYSHQGLHVSISKLTPDEVEKVLKALDGVVTNEPSA